MCVWGEPPLGSLRKGKLVPGRHRAICPSSQHLPSHSAPDSGAKFTRIPWAGVTPPPIPGSPHLEPGQGQGSDGQREDLRHFEEGPKGGTGLAPLWRPEWVTDRNSGLGTRNVQLMGQLLPDAQGRLSRKQSVGSRSRSRLPFSPRTFWPQWVRRDPHPSESELLPRGSLTHAASPPHRSCSPLTRGPSPSPQENPLLELLGEETREAWCCKERLRASPRPQGGARASPQLPRWGWEGEEGV